MIMLKSGLDRAKNNCGCAKQKKLSAAKLHRANSQIYFNRQTIDIFTSVIVGNS